MLYGFVQCALRSHKKRHGRAACQLRGWTPMLRQEMRAHLEEPKLGRGGEGGTTREASRRELILVLLVRAKRGRRRRSTDRQAAPFAMAKTCAASAWDD